MSIADSQHLSEVQETAGAKKLFYSQKHRKHSQLISLDGSQKAISDKITLFNNDYLSNKNTEKYRDIKSQSTIEFAKKTLSQLDYKRKIKQNQLKIMKIKEKCSKILTNSKSTNESNDNESKGQLISVNQQNLKIQQKQIMANYNNSDQSSEIQFTSVTKDSNRIEFLQFKNQSGYQRFRILKYVNEGSFGKVYIAQNLKNLAVFSIKVIPRKIITKDIEYQLFRQIKIQMFLNHPNIIKLYHFFVDLENIYLVLEPCLGTDLYKNLKSSSEGLTEKSIAAILKQVCQAVQYMHKNDVIHRDIKPENVLFHENVVKICDFGWAIHSPLLRDTRCGTPLYSSPEMLKKQLYDSKIDIWCIGVLAYELIYRTIPFEIHQVQDLDKIIEEQVYFSKQVNVSREGKSFITECMNKNPIQRYNIRQALQHSFLCNNDKYRCTIAC